VIWVSYGGVEGYLFVGFAGLCVFLFDEDFFGEPDFLGAEIWILLVHREVRTLRSGGDIVSKKRNRDTDLV
jgi:hypothetical protein